MKVAIVGYGVEGKASYDYWKSRGNDVTIVDERPRLDDNTGEVSTICGSTAFSELSDFDLVVRSPSVRPDKLKTNGKIWSATNEFFAKCPAPIIGVTGTKGKGTTCSLIAEILKADDRTVHLVGNIGVPALEILPRIKPDDIVVYELSSFQLWDCEKSPYIAVILAIEPDHLDNHVDFDDYVAAKSNIVRYQKEIDICFYHPTNEISAEIAKISSAKLVAAYNSFRETRSVYATGDWFVKADQNICPTATLQLPGAHNIENATAAISVCLELGTPVKAIKKGLESFKGLEHRIEFVRKLDGVSYYNDSFSSAPSATIAAVRAFSDPEVVILGGTEKGSDFSELVRVLKEQTNVRGIIIVGEIREKLFSLLQKNQVANVVKSDAKTMSEIVLAARRMAQSGDVILLSPACASFDMFKNFYDRGEQFKQVVHSL